MEATMEATLITNKTEKEEKEKEIELVRACARFSQPGTSEVTNCYTEGCYSLENPESDFYEDLIFDFNEKFKTDVQTSDEIYGYSCPEAALVRFLEEETKGKGFDIEKFVSEYLSKNETHVKREVIFTGI